MDYFSKLPKDTNSQGEEAQEIPSRVNKKMNHEFGITFFKNTGDRKTLPDKIKSAFKKILKWKLFPFKNGKYFLIVKFLLNSHAINIFRVNHFTAKQHVLD